MMKKLLNKIRKIFLKKIIEHRDEIKLMIGRKLCFLQKLIVPIYITDIGFRVFSQWDEDGMNAL